MNLIGKIIELLNVTQEGNHHPLSIVNTNKDIIGKQINDIQL